MPCTDEMLMTRPNFCRYMWLYAAVGLVLMVIGFYAIDLTTPGPLRQMVKQGRPNAVVISAAGIVSMAAAGEALKNSAAPADKIHIEVFKSLESDPFAAVVIEEDDSDEGPATAIVTLDGERHASASPRSTARAASIAAELDAQE